MKSSKRCKTATSKCGQCGIIVIFNDEHVNPYVQYKTKKGDDLYICADCKYSFEQDYKEMNRHLSFVIDYC